MHQNTSQNPKQILDFGNWSEHDFIIIFSLAPRSTIFCYIQSK